MSMWGEYVSVSERRQRAQKEMEKLRKKGQTIEPVAIDGRLIAKKFWGKNWCAHLEAFADYENRLPRGRTYARNGSICHLNIKEGRVEAFVSGSSLYKISVTIKTLCKDKWKDIKKRCSGKIGSILEILQGKLSEHVMGVVADHKAGLFPHPKEISFKCNCPDWADMCKHVAAVLYGIGNRLDEQPELLFQLRGLDVSELVGTQLSVEMETTADQIDDGELADIFGIELENEPRENFAPPSSIKKIMNSPKTKETKEDTKTPKQAQKGLNLERLTGKKLRAFRESIKLNVNEFAKAVGMTPASIYRWEQNRGILKLHLRSKEALTDLLRKHS